MESLAKKYELQPTRISGWRSQAPKGFGSLFATSSDKKDEKSSDLESLFSQIGRLKVENDFLKKSCNEKCR
ncbi:MAG: transposase [Paludibacteraceae bacterium]